MGILLYLLTGYLRGHLQHSTAILKGYGAHPTLHPTLGSFP
jgi:hypothetical protein